MRKIVLPAVVAILVASVAVGQDKPGHEGDTKHVVMKPTTLKWGAAPPSLPPGAQMAILIGDPSKAGPYVARAKFPDGYKVPPHWHPTDENVTVVQGTFLMGTGDKFDTATLEELPVGSYVNMPKTMRHYAMAKGETIIQLHGMGPFEINYVNASDDPRKKTK